MLEPGGNGQRHPRPRLARVTVSAGARRLRAAGRGLPGGLAVLALLGAVGCGLSPPPPRAPASESTVPWTLPAGEPRASFALPEVPGTVPLDVSDTNLPAHRWVRLQGPIVDAWVVSDRTLDASSPARFRADLLQELGVPAEGTATPAQAEAAAVAIYQFVIWNMQAGGAEPPRTFPELAVSPLEVATLPAGVEPRELWNTHLPGQLLGSGYGSCSRQSSVIGQLAVAVGLSARSRQFRRPGRPSEGHTGVEVAYAGRWRFFDPYYQMTFRGVDGFVADFATVRTNIPDVAHRAATDGTGPMAQSGRDAAEAYSWQTVTDRATSGPDDTPWLQAPPLGVTLGSGDDLVFWEDAIGPPANPAFAEPYSSVLLRRTLVPEGGLHVAADAPWTHCVSAPLPPGAHRLQVAGRSDARRLSVQVHLRGMAPAAARRRDVYAPLLRAELELWKRTRPDGPLQRLLDVAGARATPEALAAWYEAHVYGPAMAERGQVHDTWWEVWNHDGRGPFAADFALPEMLRGDMAWTLRIVTQGGAAHVETVRLEQWLQATSSLGPWPRPGTQVLRVHGRAVGAEVPRLDVGWQSVAGEPDVDESTVTVGPAAPADGLGFVMLTLHVRDRAGTPVRGHPVHLAVDPAVGSAEQIPGPPGAPSDPSPLLFAGRSDAEGRLYARVTSRGALRVPVTIALGPSAQPWRTVKVPFASAPTVEAPPRVLRPLPTHFDGPRTPLTG